MGCLQGKKEKTSSITVECRNPNAFEFWTDDFGLGALYVGMQLCPKSKRFYSDLGGSNDRPCMFERPKSKLLAAKLDHYVHIYIHKFIYKTV